MPNTLPGIISKGQDLYWAIYSVLSLYLDKKRGVQEKVGVEGVPEGTAEGTPETEC